METIAKQLAVYLQDKESFDLDLYEVHVYGIEIALSSAINIFITFVQALCFGRPLDAIIYLVCTRPFRKNGGGWHSKTHMLCVTLHAFAFATVSWISFLLQHSITVQFLIAGYTFVLILSAIKAPAEHPNNPIYPSERPKMKRKCISIVLGASVLSLIALALEYSHNAALIMFSTISAAVTLLIPSKLLL